MGNGENGRNEKELRAFELLKLEYDKCLDQRRFEIDNFWKRGWFFGALMLAIGTGYFQAKDDDGSYRVYIAFLGVCVSLFQGFMNRGSKYWQERWEAKTKRRESLLGIDVTKTKQFREREKYFLDAGILAKAETWLNRGARWSVSKLTFLIWDLITLSWGILWVSNWPISPNSSISQCANEHGFWIVHGVFFLYIFFFFINGKVFEGFLKKIKPDRGRYAPPFFADSERYIKGDLGLEELVAERLKEFDERPLEE